MPPSPRGRPMLSLYWEVVGSTSPVTAGGRFECVGVERWRDPHGRRRGRRIRLSCRCHRRIRVHRGRRGGKIYTEEERPPDLSLPLSLMTDPHVRVGERWRDPRRVWKRRLEVVAAAVIPLPIAVVVTTPNMSLPNLRGRVVESVVDAESTIDNIDVCPSATLVMAARKGGEERRGEEKKMEGARGEAKVSRREGDRSRGYGESEYL